jgi:hypothetical protein
VETDESLLHCVLDEIFRVGVITGDSQGMLIQQANERGDVPREAG